MGIVISCPIIPVPVIALCCMISPT
jgi:hypothetical protein